MKYLLLLEMPASVDVNKRTKITKLLRQVSLEQPKRNVFIIEAKSENKMGKLKQMIIDESGSSKTKVEYYLLAEQD